GSVLALAATGLVRALGELSAVSELWSTSYGRALLVKTGLLGALVLLGARNRYRLVPRLRAASARNPAALRAFAGLRRSLVAELCLLAVLVGAVALLTELPPGRSARAAERPPRGPSASRAPALPRPGERAARVFGSLRSLVIDERLASNPRTVIRTRFEIVAPDRLAYRIVGGQQAVVVGGRRWDRSPNGRWQPSQQSPLRLPAAP